MDALLWRGLRRLRSAGFAGFVRASRDYAAHRRRCRVDTRLDRKFGTDTTGIIAASSKPERVAAHADNWTGYQPIQIPVFEAIMQTLPIDPARYSFLDYGSGKGRALLLAALHGFRRAIGVEFMPALHDVARRNVVRFERARGRRAPIELHCQDAAGVALPPDDLVCFMYNPFDPGVLRPVLHNVIASVDAHPRPVWLVYRNPVHAHLLDETARVLLFADHDAFRIYRTCA